jgi:hypothetical protein
MSKATTPKSGPELQRLWLSELVCSNDLHQNDVTDDDVEGETDGENEVHGASSQTAGAKGLSNGDQNPKEGSSAASIAKKPLSRRSKPQRIMVHLDKPWSRLTWSSKAKKDDMLRLLEEAGEDTTNLKLKNTSKDIIDAIVVRREKRVAAGLLPAMKDSRTQTRDFGITVFEPRKKKSVQENVKAKDSCSDQSLKPRLDIATARAHLGAIEQQVYDDALFNNSDQHVYLRDTVLKDQFRKVLFTEETQKAIAVLLCYRDAILHWDAQVGGVAEESRTGIQELQLKHSELGEQVIHAIHEKVGNGLYGLVEVAQLVNELFGVTEYDS